MPATLPAVVESAVDRVFPGRMEHAMCVQAGSWPGSMSQTTRILFGDELPAPRSIFAKWASNHPLLRRVAYYTQSYQREVQFYRHLARQSPVRMPKNYAAEYEAASGDFVLLLEDLSERRAGDPFQSAVADVEEVLRTIAHFHAYWAHGSARAPHDWLKQQTRERSRRYARIELRRALGALERGAIEDGWCSGVLHRVLHALQRRLDAFLDGLEDRRQTLVHGDLHLSQVFFDPTVGVRRSPAFVDWQTIQLGNVGIDVARAIVLNLSVPDRRTWELELLESYGAALHAGARTQYAASERLLDYLEGIRWSALVSAIHYLSLPLGRDRSGHRVLLERIAFAAEDHGL